MWGISYPQTCMQKQISGKKKKKKKSDTLTKYQSRVQHIFVKKKKKKSKE